MKELGQDIEMGDIETRVSRAEALDLLQVWKRIRVQAELEAQKNGDSKLERLLKDNDEQKLEELKTKLFIETE